jgi:hypothetical protein
MDTSGFFKIYRDIWFDPAANVIIYQQLFDAGHKCVCGYYIQQYIFESVAFKTHYASKYQLPEVYDCLSVDDKQRTMLIIVINNPPILLQLADSIHSKHCD